MKDRRQDSATRTIEVIATCYYLRSGLFQHTSKEFSKQPLVHNKTPQDLCTENPETPHSNSCTTWQHTGCGQHHCCQRFTIFHTKKHKERMVYLSERKRAPEADKHSSREIVGPAPWRWAAIEEVGTSLMGVSYGTLVLSLDSLATRFRKHLHWILIHC